MSTLYTTRLLGLSAQLAGYPFRENFTSIATGRSAICGSTIKVGIDFGADGRVSDIGMQVTACAIGQSSAAILAGGIKGASGADVRIARAALRAWTQGHGDLPEWPEIEAIAPARDHPGRHGALLLSWDAVVSALDQV